LTKQGAGTFTIATGANNYTGQTVISGGILNVTVLANGGSPSSIGAASASPTNLVLNGGTFSYSGVPTAVNRGYSLIGGLSTITVQSNLTLSGLVTAAAGSSSTKIGPARLTYTTTGVNAHSGNNSAGYRVEQGATVFDGSAGGQTNNVTGHLGVGGLGAVNADLALTNSTLNVLSGGLDLGRSGGATGTLTVATGGVFSKQGGTFALGDGGGQPSFGVVNQTGGFIDSGDELWVGQGVSGVGTYNFSSGTYNQHNWLAVGRRGGYGTFTMTGGTLTKDGNGNIVIGTGGSGSVATLQQSGGTINNSSEYWLAENGGTEATNNISGTAILNLGNWMSIGRGGHGVINFSGGAINKTGGGNFIIGDGGNGYFNQTGGTLNISSELWIGQSGSGTGRFDLSGGAVTNNSWLAVGREGGNGTLNISGGSMTKNGGGSISIAHGGGPGTINQTGGTFTSTSDTWVGEDSNTGTWNLSNGTVNLAIVHLAQNASATGIVNLDGGTFSASELTTGNAGGTSRLFLNGGTLTATANNTNFLHGLTAANVKAGGAVINSGNNVIGISQSLLDAGGGGGLTKLGNGTLYLNGVNSYTGLTLVNSGALGGTGIIVGPVSVASLATLAPGTALIGTLTVSNTLSLAAGSTTLVKVSLDGGGTNNDLVTGLTTVAYSGSLVVTNIGSNALAAGAVFKLFNATNAGGNFSSVTILPSGTGTFNPATGQLTIGATTPVTIQSTVAPGGNLILAGAGGTAGGSYAILTSTNVAAPLTTWTTNVTGVFDGSGGFSNAIPITPTESRRFFLIKTP
jgi:autotransporter-associated beta strand protein